MSGRVAAVLQKSDGALHARGEWVDSDPNGHGLPQGARDGEMLGATGGVGAGRGGLSVCRDSSLCFLPALCAPGIDLYPVLQELRG